MIVDDNGLLDSPGFWVLKNLYLRIHCAFNGFLSHREIITPKQFIYIIGGGLEKGKRRGAKFDDDEGGGGCQYDDSLLDTGDLFFV